MALIDDYNHYHCCNFKALGGKLFLLNQKDDSIIQIFLDDNAEDGEKSIIDTWDISTMKRISNKEIFGKSVLKVDPLQVLTDPDYFIKLITRTLGLENTLLNEDADNPLRDSKSNEEWLKGLSKEAYLDQTVMPFLQAGLEIIEKERPSDPVKWLGMFLLQHKDLELQKKNHL